MSSVFLIRFVLIGAGQMNIFDFAKVEEICGIKIYNNFTQLPFHSQHDNIYL